MFSSWCEDWNTAQSRSQASLNEDSLDLPAASLKLHKWIRVRVCLEIPMSLGSSFLVMTFPLVKGYNILPIKELHI